MSKVFVNIGLTLDGYMAPEGMSIEHWETPEYKNWGAKWGALMGWVLKQQYFRENLKFGLGADVIQQYLTMGVIDEFEIALAPVLFGGGRRLFENMNGELPQFRIDSVLHTADATHLRYVRG